MAGVLKCCYRINQYGNRDKQINPNKTEECPQCSAKEMQEQIVQYSKNPIEDKVDFIIDLYIKLMRVKQDTIEPQIIKDIIVDIREYLRCGDEYRIN